MQGTADVGTHKYPAMDREVAATLKYRYHDFAHYNLKDPLDELLFIICSTKTEEASYRNTFRALKKSFPTHHKIAEAPAKYIAQTIAKGGLSNVKAMTSVGLFGFNLSLSCVVTVVAEIGRGK